MLPCSVQVVIHLVHFILLYVCEFVHGARVCQHLLNHTMVIAIGVRHYYNNALTATIYMHVSINAHCAAYTAQLQDKKARCLWRISSPHTCNIVVRTIVNNIAHDTSEFSCFVTGPHSPVSRDYLNEWHFRLLHMLIYNGSYMYTLVHSLPCDRNQTQAHRY